MKKIVPKITLDEIKNRLMQQYNITPAGVSSKIVPTSKVTEDSIEDMLNQITHFMIEFPDEACQLAESIGKGEDFRYYFTSKETIKELLDMKSSDPDSFYRILKKEEIFINYILRIIGGYEHVIVSFGPEYVQDLYDKLDDDDYDEQ